MTDPKPLPDDIKQVVDSSPNGVILVTFGSALVELPTGFLSVLMKAFSKLNLVVIMQHKNTDRINSPSNVHLYNWLPQNDILGHPKTKLFITHGGNNGQLEAIYHAVPMITLPLFSDQVSLCYITIHKTLLFTVIAI